MRLAIKSTNEVSCSTSLSLLFSMRYIVIMLNLIQN